MIGRREYPAAPIVGVSAAVFHADRVLLVRRAKPPLAGEWSLPGGAVELGETLEEAILREMMEETGLTIDVHKVLHVMDRIDKDDSGRVRYHYVLITFLCGVGSANDSAREVAGRHAATVELYPATDASDARWVPVEGLRTSKEFPLRSRTLDVIFAGWDEAQNSGLTSATL